MARLIDSDSLLGKINDTAEGLADCDQQNAAWALRKYAVRDIMDAETVDAVEVVRCKDCIRYKNDVACSKHSRGSCEFDNERKSRNHFCSYGERRTDG